METTLATLLFVLVIHASIAGRPRRLGVLLALLFLTRLDTAVFVAAPIVIGHFLIDRAPKRTLAMALPVGIIFALYTGYNLWRTGHAVPISGAIKSSFPLITWHGAYLIEPLNVAAMYGIGTLLTANILLVALLLVFGFALFAIGRNTEADDDVRKRPASVDAAEALRARAKLLLIGIIAGLLFANLLLFQQWEKTLDPRYLALPLTASAFFFSAALGRALQRTRPPYRERVRLVATGVAVVLLAAETIAFAARFEHDYAQTTDPVMMLFRDVRAAIPENAVVVGTDVGALAFWTQRRVINLDGVINNYDYQTYLRDRRLADYLREQRVDHVATALTDQEPIYTERPVEPMYRHAIDAPATHGTDYSAHDYYVYSYVHHVYSDAIQLTPQQEVFRRRLGRAGDAEVVYVVYRIR
jgi:hypothetical protein